MIRRAIWSLPLLAWAVLALTACPSEIRSEALDPSSLPAYVRADYDVFAQRCSKCHSLARPLNSGIIDDGYWKLYVARMRRQPGSGISMEDTDQILRFLHYYSMEEIRKKGWHESPPPPPEAPEAVAPPVPGPPRAPDAGAP